MIYTKLLHEKAGKIVARHELKFLGLLSMRKICTVYKPLCVVDKRDSVKHLKS